MVAFCRLGLFISNLYSTIRVNIRLVFSMLAFHKKSFRGFSAYFVLGFLVFAFQNCSTKGFQVSDPATEAVSSSLGIPGAGGYFYTWIGTDWGSCSAVCAGGTQNRKVTCKRNDGMPADESLCKSAKPPTAQSCNTQTCSNYMWIQSGFSPCSKICGGGTQTQTVVCKTTASTVVDDGLCSGAKPSTTQSCNTQACPPVQQSCNVANGSGTQSLVNDNGTYGPCVANQCNSGFLLSNGTCVSEILYSAATCDGQKNVTSQIQAEINQAVGRQLIINQRGCVISGLSVPGNSHITINGTILLASNANKSMIFTEYVSNVIIDGSGTLDGNRDNQPGCGGCAGVSVYGGSNITIGSPNGILTIQNIFSWPVNMVGVNGALMQNVTAMNGGNSVEFAGGTSNCLATGLNVSGIRDEGFAFYGGVYNCTLRSSILHNNEAAGVSILNDAGQTSPVHDIGIFDIESYGNGSSGIAIDSGGGASGNHYNVQISGANLHNNNLSPIFTEGAGLYNRTGTNLNFSSSQIHDSGGTSRSEIYLGPLTSGSVIDGVTIQNGNGIGILSSGASNVVVSNSQFLGNPLTSAISGSGPRFQQFCNGFGATSGKTINLDYSPLDNSVIGIFGVDPTGNGGYEISGWACGKNIDRSINVSLYVGGPLGDSNSIGISWYLANASSEPAVASACSGNGTAYRFHIPLSADFRQAYRGKSIYVYGISPTCGANAMLNNSGSFAVP